MPSLHLTIWITNLNVLVQLAEEWISIGENVGPLKLSRFFSVQNPIFTPGGRRSSIQS